VASSMTVASKRSTNRDDAPAIKLALVGCGKFSRRYHVPAIEKNPAIRLSFICDLSIGPEITDVAARLGARTTTRLEDLWADDACDGIVVSTPHILHAAQAAACLEHNKPVLMDKPFVLKSAEGQGLADMARARRIIAGVAFNRRLDAACVRAREIIRGGGIGSIRHVETVQLGYEYEGWITDPKLSGGGPFTGRGAHMADLVPWLADAEPKRVSARLRPGKPGLIDAGGVADIEFADFTWRMTCIDQGLHMWDEVRVYGDRGLLEIRRPLDIPVGWQLTHRGEKREPLEHIPADGTPGASTLNFAAALRGDEPLACTFAQAVTSVRVIEAAFDSAAAEGAWRTT
jgi:predicted dehydrogenase